MKKSISLLCIIAIILSMSFSVFAGSIPEDLLNSDDAQIFFAEVIYYHPDKENPDIELSPVEVVKGDVKRGVKLTYYNPNIVGNFRIKEGNTYLFTYIDEHNPTDIFKAENNGVFGIKLKNIEGDMWKRFERYLNEGRYFQAEQERRQKSGLPLMIDNPLAMGYLPYLKNTSDGKNLYIGLFIAVAFAVGFVIGFAVKKRR